MADPPLTFRRLVGLDRSGGPPPQTQRGQPLNPWTIPNAIGFARVALLPVFLYLAFDTDDGRSTAAVVVYAVIAWSDYADGIAARVTGQYSRLGALLDPVVDRLSALAGIAVNWHFEFLPRWALVVLAVREVVTLVLARMSLRRGVDLEISWVGRLATLFTFGGLFWSLVFDSWITVAIFLIGVALGVLATLLYVQATRRQLARMRAGDG